MFAQAWVASAPTSGSAAGTPAPTARNFDCTATPHSRASRSQATIEYVEGLAIFELAKVELEQFAVVRRDEHAGDLGPFESRLDGFGRARADDDRDSLRMRFLQALDVGEVVDDQGISRWK